MRMQPRRTLYRGGEVYSPERFANAMLVDGDRIAWIGTDDAAVSYVDVADEIIELDGALITPGFVDAHVHLTATGLQLIGVDVAQATSVDSLVSAVASCTDSRVVGHGWDDTHWARSPHRSDIDAVAAGRPVYVSRVDVHSALVSSALLDAIPGIRQLDGYDESGVLTAAAHHAARRFALVEIPSEIRQRAVRTALARAASLGIVSVHECGGPDIGGEDDFRQIIQIAADSVLPEPLLPEVVGYWGELLAVDRARDLGAVGAAGDLFADGSLGSHTACLSLPYNDADTVGRPYLDVADIAAHVVACTDAQVQAGFHVIGDAAMANVIAGFQEAVTARGAASVRSAGHRLEHVEMITDADIAVLADLGITASMQPRFDEYWGGEHGMYAKRLGVERARGLNPFATLAAAGVSLAFGSDAPVTELGPWAAVKAATAHQTVESRISTRAAFAAHTRGGRRAARQLDHGVLIAGAPASFAIWSVDQLAVQVPDQRVSAWSTDPRAAVTGLPVLDGDMPTCLTTVRDGHVIYSHEPVNT